MQDERILCAGFGGQGVMVLGKLIACAAMLDGREVTWMPSYGPEMRGGTAYCSVVVSDRPVGSPIVTSDATSLIVMNLPSLDRFEESVVPGGLILLNKSLIDREVGRNDVLVHSLEANNLAAECSDPRAANMVMLGAYMAMRGFLHQHQVEASFGQVFEKGSSHRFATNKKAIQRGSDSVSAAVQIRRAA